MNEADHNIAEEKRHGAAALQDAGASTSTPLCPRGFGVRQPHAAFWKSASVFGAIASVIATGFWLNSALAAKKAAPRIENDAEFANVVNRINLAFENFWQEAHLSPAPAAPILTITRRLSLGLTGTLPSLEEIRLLEKQQPDQAVQWWLTHLFEDRRYSSYVAERLARTYVGVEDGPFLIYRRHRLTDWLGEQLHQNRPYDQLARSLINSRGIWTTQPEVNFITVTVDQNQKPQFPDETKLAGRNVARAASFSELLAPERRAAIFQSSPADTEANAKMLKALLTLIVALEQPSANENELIAIAQDFVSGDDAMRTYRQVYVAGRFVKKGVALSTAVDLTDQATSGVEAALSVPAATVAVQPDELADIRARALTGGGTPNIPDAPRSALAGILRGRIEDLAGLALFNLDRPAEAATRFRRAVSVSPEGTPLWRSALWHLGSALEAGGKSDQALLYYIKSYVAGAPDPARRAVIESVYKKVNGTLEGLDDKIGPGFTTATAPTPTPSPTPQ